MFKEKLHSTCQSDNYYLDYNDLPEIVRSFIEKEYAALTVIDCSRYTVFNPTLFIRHDCTIEGVKYQIEITLSDVNKETTEEQLEQDIDSYLETDWNEGTIYIRELA